MARTQAADYQERRETIINKAAELFASKGFLGTSVMDIARACDASKSLLYHYFPSKEDVLQGVMSSHIDRLIDNLEDVQAAPGTSEAKLDRLIKAFMADYVGAAAHQSVLLDELDNLPTDARREIIAKQRRIVDAVQAWLVDIHPQLKNEHGKARALTMLLFGMINWTGNWYDPAGPISPDEISRLAVTMVKRAVVAD
ncbi:AcrR family transcriptional regulator [Novosphingobium sp. 1529]|uniref:TetR/AcrR family transcriptional regulator n=1 Tax=Novosphingobium sp. 1529 TaxID=3156424 RepID=UPI00145B7B1F